MMRLQTKPALYLARPGLPSHYRLHQVARLLGVRAGTLHRDIRNGHLEATHMEGSRPWWIARSEVIRYARQRYSDRPARLASILSQGIHSVIALTQDPEVRQHLGKYSPRYASSPFALGQMLAVYPAAVLVIDWEASGSGWAKDIADRLGSCPDRPWLVGLLPADVTMSPRGWDAVLTRPADRLSLQSAVRDLLDTGK